jgi:hypothetical protein
MNRRERARPTPPSLGALKAKKKTKKTPLTQNLEKVAGGTGPAPKAEAPKEEVTFECGGLAIQYAQQKND